MSMMSAPFSISCLACCSATVGSRNWPPSEKESGVTLRIPMMMGRFFARSRPSMFGRRPAKPPFGPPMGPIPSGEFVPPVIVISSRFARGTGRCQALARRSVGDLEYQPFGLVDPALDGAVGGQDAGELALGIGVGHGAGKLGWVAVFQFLDGVDACGLQQAGIVRPDAFDPHP